MHNIKGKKCIVTGVSKGIGKATVQSLLDHGAIVYGWGRNNCDIEHENYQFFELDVRDHDAVNRVMAETTAAAQGQIDLLLNNAGLGKFGPLESMNLDDWHVQMDTNVNGLFYCTKAVLPVMKAQQSGHIINISSVAGLLGLEGASCYCATKHAVRGISHSLMKEVRKDGIKVSCVYPGSTDTNFFDDVEGVNDDSRSRMMRAEDIATAILEAFGSHSNLLTVDIELRPLQP